MKLENSFEVAAPPERRGDPHGRPAHRPCMPGATLDEVVDDSNWKATMQVKLGPIGLTFATDVERKEVDEAEPPVVLGANARETRNRGRASATIESSLAPTTAERRSTSSPTSRSPGRSRSTARDDRGHLVADGHELRAVSEAQLGESAEEAEQAVAAQAKPVSGFSPLRQPLAPHPKIGRRSS